MLYDLMVFLMSNFFLFVVQEFDVVFVLLYQIFNSGKDFCLWNVQEVMGFMYFIGCFNYVDVFIKEVCLICSYYCFCIVVVIFVKS